MSAAHNQRMCFLVDELHLTLSSLQPPTVIRQVTFVFARLLWVIPPNCILNRVWLCLRDH